MSAGRLKERIIIQQLDVTPDGRGGRTKAWSTYSTVSASVRPTRTGENIEAQRVTQQIGYEVTVRYNAGLKPEMRVLWTPYGGSQKELSIRSIVNFDMKKKRHVLICQEGELG